MAILSVRGIPEGLMRKLKAQAATSGKTLGAYVVESLGMAVGDFEAICGKQVVTNDWVGREPGGMGCGDMVPTTGGPYTGDDGLPDHVPDQVALDPKPVGGKRSYDRCAHGSSRGENCWQCGGKAVVGA